MIPIADPGLAGDRSTERPGRHGPIGRHGRLSLWRCRRAGNSARAARRPDAV